MGSNKMSNSKVIHADLEIGIIDLTLMKQCLNEFAPKGEAGRLIREEGIPWNEVQEIRIEFRNIFKIDHLWMLTDLTKLSLANNRIEKIENLDSLEHLRELDLSFNKIDCIENLNSLVNLEILTLYGNKIKVLENFQNLEKLLIFSVGNNQIEDLKNVLYLRQFEELRSLNLAGNACCQQANIREWVAGFLPQIVYYEYKMIEIEEKEAAAEKFKYEIIKVVESEQETLNEKLRIKAEAAEEALHAFSFVEFLGTSALFDKLFDGDIDGKLLLTMPKPVIKENFQTYKENFCEVTRKLFDIGQEMYLTRQLEIEQFLKCVEGEKSRIQIQSQDIIEHFMDKKLAFSQELVSFYETVEESELDPKSNAYEAMMEEFRQRASMTLGNFAKLGDDTWMELMKCELTLNAQLEEVNETFSIVITDMLNSFLEKSSAHFTELRTMEREWAEELLDIAFTTMNEYAAGGKIEAKMTRDLEKLFADKENVVQCCAGSHDYHNLQIDQREDRLVSRANSWLNSLVSSLTKDELARSRAQVLEINKFLDSQREQFQNLYDEYVVPSTSTVSSITTDIGELPESEIEEEEMQKE